MFVFLVLHKVYCETSKSLIILFKSNVRHAETRFVISHFRDTLQSMWRDIHQTWSQLGIRWHADIESWDWPRLQHCSECKSDSLHQRTGSRRFQITSSDACSRTLDDMRRRECQSPVCVSF